VVSRSRCSAVFGLQVSHYKGELLKEGGKYELSGYRIGYGIGGSLFGLIGVIGGKLIWSGRQRELKCGTSSKDDWKLTMHACPHIITIPSRTYLGVFAMIFLFSFVLIFQNVISHECVS